MSSWSLVSVCAAGLIVSSPLGLCHVCCIAVLVVSLPCVLALAGSRPGCRVASRRPRLRFLQSPVSRLRACPLAGPLFAWMWPLCFVVIAFRVCVSTPLLGCGLGVVLPCLPTPLSFCWADVLGCVCGLCGVAWCFCPCWTSLQPLGCICGACVVLGTHTRAPLLGWVLSVTHGRRDILGCGRPLRSCPASCFLRCVLFVVSPWKLWARTLALAELRSDL